MRKKMLVIALIAVSSLGNCTDDFAPNEQYPFGQYNPLAPKEIKDFADLIGRAECESKTRIDQDSWAAPVAMTWTFKYILNGMGIQDETLKNDGVHSGSIRLFNVDTQQWHVHYYTTKNTLDRLPAWKGGKEGDDLVFWKEHDAPNGMPGFYRLTFYDITSTSYQWVGAWIDQAKTVVYPTWKISCKKIQ